MAKNPLDQVYRLPKPYVDTRPVFQKTRRNAIVLGALVLFALGQHLGWALRGAYFMHKPEWGPFYSVPQIIDWISILFGLHGAWHDMVVGRELRFAEITIAAMFVLIYLVHRRMMVTVPPIPDVQGSARFATDRDIKKTNNQREQTGLYFWKGPYLCAVPDPSALLGLFSGQQFIRSDPETHTLLVAPTGTKKTTAYVIPSALTWLSSMFQYDPKGEIYERTAKRREEMGQRVMPLDLMDQTGFGARLNPLDFLDLDSPTIIKDVGVITSILSDPDGTGPGRGLTQTEQHFLSIGSSVAQAGIVFAKMLEEVDDKGNIIPETRASLTKVGDVFVGSEDGTGELPTSTVQLLHDIASWKPNPRKRYRYKPSKRLQEFVHKSITDIILMTEAERSGVINTFKRFFAPYREFAVAQATSETTFVDVSGQRLSWDPKDLVTNDPAKYISLYLIIAPRDRTFLRPVVRMILNVIVGFLIDAKTHEAAARDPLWMCIDEFDTLGRLNIIEDNINILRSFKVMLSLIIQGFSQIYGTYGRDEKLTIACRNLVVYTPASGDTETKNKVSELLGSMHLRYKLPGLGDKGQAHLVEHARRLLTPDETGRLPRTLAIVFTDSCDRPILGYKHAWFEVGAFKALVKPPRVSLEALVIARDKQRFEGQPVDDNVVPLLSREERRRLRIDQAVAQSRAEAPPAAHEPAPPPRLHLPDPPRNADFHLDMPELPTDFEIEPPEIGHSAA